MLHCLACDRQLPEYSQISYPYCNTCKRAIEKCYAIDSKLVDSYDDELKDELCIKTNTNIVYDI